MPNKRFTETQEDGALSQARRDHLKAHPMSPAEAARILCEVHLAPDGRVIVGVIPDFTKVDGELYHEAWRVLRAFGGAPARGGETASSSPDDLPKWRLDSKP